jgi:hypothetical protein
MAVECTCLPEYFSTSIWRILESFGVRILKKNSAIHQSICGGFLDKDCPICGMEEHSVKILAS